MLNWIKRKLSNTVAKCAVRIMMDPGDKILGAVECRGVIYIITQYSIYRYEPDSGNCDGVLQPSISKETYTR
jgi:hypothetical protein